MIKRRYRRILEGYLLWREGNLFLPELLIEDPKAEAPELVMKLWESEGRPLPRRCQDPVKLAQYIQGKISRDWHITEWRKDVKDGLCKAEEFVGTMGCNEENYRKLLERA